MKDNMQNEFKLMFKSVLYFIPVTTTLYLKSKPAEEKSLISLSTYRSFFKICHS